MFWQIFIIPLVSVFFPVAWGSELDGDSNPGTEPVVKTDDVLGGRPKSEDGQGGKTKIELKTGASDQDTATVVAEQKKCRLVIRTTDIRILTQKTGSLLDLVKDDISIPARINRSEPGKIFATLRKRDCDKQMIGAQVTVSNTVSNTVNNTVSRNKPRIGRTTEPAQTTEIVSEPELELAEDPTVESEARTVPARVRRPSDDGPQLAFGFRRLSAKGLNESLIDYGARFSYEWFASPHRSVRRETSGATAGLGLTLDGLGGKGSESLFDGYSSSILMKVGYRYATRSFGFSAAGTFKYIYMVNYLTERCVNDECTKSTELKFFEDEMPHPLGIEAQFDFSLGEQMRFVVIPNYTVIVMNAKNQNFTIIDVLAGLWFTL